jgi:membrane protein
MVSRLYSTIRFGVRVIILSGKRYAADQHKQRAVALTFYTLFAVVPLAALMFGIAKGFALDEKLRVVLNEKLAQHKELLEYVYRFADTTLKQASGGLVAGVGVIALIWTVMWLANNIELAFNAVWGLPPRKNLLRKFSDYLAIMLLIPIVLVLLSSAGVFLHVLFDRLAGNLNFLGGAPAYVLSLLGTIIPVLLVIVLFSLIYFVSPNTKVRLGPAVFAGVIAGISFQLLQDGFVYLQGSIYRYNRIYGSFAALPLFLMWMQWSWQIALFGAEIGFVGQNLDTGLFDDDQGPAVSPRRHRVLQLGICSLIYRKFMAGSGAASADELLATVRCSPMQLSRELRALLDAGLILRAAEGQGKGTSYVPALPPENTTVADCCQKLDMSGAYPETTENALLPAEQILAAFSGIDARDPANKKIFELCS